MKKLFLISLLFVAMHSALCAQAPGLSEEGYKHWQKAMALMDNIKKESDYFLVTGEFNEVLKTDSTYADAYYNLAVLNTKVGDLGGGISFYDAAKKYYDKYLTLQPSEKTAIIKELAQLEVKKESFIRNLGLDDMVLIQGGEVKEKKNIIKIEPFYVQDNMFTIADFKSLITPMAIAVAQIRNPKIKFKIPTRQSPTGSDDFPYTSSFNTAEQIVKVLSCITGKNYFIPKLNHITLIRANTALHFGKDGDFAVVEWLDDAIVDSGTPIGGLLVSALIVQANANTGNRVIADFGSQRNGLNRYSPDTCNEPGRRSAGAFSLATSFRLALPASEYNK